MGDKLDGQTLHKQLIIMAWMNNVEGWVEVYMHTDCRRYLKGSLIYEEWTDIKVRGRD